jgi:hypothetical protein
VNEIPLLKMLVPPETVAYVSLSEARDHEWCVAYHVSGCLLFHNGRPIANAGPLPSHCEDVISISAPLINVSCSTWAFPARWMYIAPARMVMALPWDVAARAIKYEG